MSWFGLYVSVGIPALLLLMGYGLVRYDEWERRHEPR
jgi:hypothetical protein